MSHVRDIAWSAGLFEGEGCIQINRKNRKGIRPQVHLTLKMTDLDVVKRFAKAVGFGSIRGPYQYSTKHKPAWVWTWHGREALAWAQKNWLHLLGKRRRAKLLEAIKVEAAAPYKTEGFKRWARGLNATSRKCNRCKKELPHDSFSPRSYQCKPCRAFVVRTTKKARRRR